MFPRPGFCLRFLWFTFLFRLVVTIWMILLHKYDFIPVPIANPLIFTTFSLHHLVGHAKNIHYIEFHGSHDSHFRCQASGSYLTHFCQNFFFVAAGPKSDNTTETDIYNTNCTWIKHATTISFALVSLIFVPFAIFVCAQSRWIV